MLAVSILVCAMLALARADDTNTTEHMVDIAKNAHRVACQEHWQPFMANCYHYVYRPMSWIDAEKNCLSMKGNLASIHSLEEYQFIQRMVQGHSETEGLTWIGGSNCQENSAWLWTDGKPFFYENWCPGEPNNMYGREHCLQMNARDQHCWNDKQCSDPYPSVCISRGWSR